MLEGLFVDWENLVKACISSVAIYFACVVCIRIFGKRTTSKMNNFDWIITVMIGAIAASGVILENVGIGEAVIAIVILFTLQWLVTFLACRFEFVDRLLRAPSKLIYVDGEIQESCKQKERIAQSEIYSAVRRAGYDSFDQVFAIVMESDAQLSVVGKKDVHTRKSIEGCCGSEPSMQGPG